MFFGLCSERDHFNVLFPPCEHERFWDKLDFMAEGVKVVTKLKRG